MFYLFLCSDDSRVKDHKSKSKFILHIFLLYIFYSVTEYSNKMLFHPYIPEDLSDDDNDYGEDEEEEDDGGDSDFDAKEASRGRQATAKRKRAAGITSINSVTASFIT